MFWAELATLAAFAVAYKRARGEAAAVTERTDLTVGALDEVQAAVKENAGAPSRPTISPTKGAPRSLIRRTLLRITARSNTPAAKVRKMSRNCARSYQ